MKNLESDTLSNESLSEEIFTEDSLPSLIMKNETICKIINVFFWENFWPFQEGISGPQT